MERICIAVRQRQRLPLRPLIRQAYLAVEAFRRLHYVDGRRCTLHGCRRHYRHE